ncbi:phosphatidate cytidylyltransferase [Roseovarius spongiae]|uniref:Phosphatidate cytidylyltransferase n=1 Tax=Roseovarius spongiae TaxID=2320272 RepID=A0A3A8AYD0_9RHOB|nr:phosphatidate cytidylyltransferase [Roseovarius spongiae]RKF15251.1 phosphatidate cytidylyltransferase [Roseovarius spongiae]
MSGIARWSDLAPRVISAAVMIVLGAIALRLGGIVFAMGVWALAGVMTWELTRMFAPGQGWLAVGLGCFAAAALAFAWLLPGALALPLLLAAALTGMSRMERDRYRFGGYAAAILVGCHVMILLRDVIGPGWVLWLICVVIASDVAGYFVGRSLGGPKFWPRISPKKTWSGTIGGWVAAGLVGLVFGLWFGAGAALAPVSVIVAFAGQMGDILESALKRRAGVKDSSNIIPGHGGVLDRFDAMLGAALIVGLLWALRLAPGLA